MGFQRCVRPLRAEVGEEIAAPVLQTTKRFPPLLPGSRTNRNSPLIQHWPSVTLQWGSQVLFQVLLTKILLFPGSGKLNWAPVETEVEFHLSSLCRSYLGSALSPLVAGRRGIIVTSSCLGDSSVTNKQFQVLEPRILGWGFRCA